MVGEHPADIRLLGDTHATVTVLVLDAARSTMPAPVDVAPPEVAEQTDAADASEATEA